jgi:hypothetical protein
MEWILNQRNTMTAETRRIFHITAGNDTWNPTDEELDTICNSFKEAVCNSFKEAVVDSPGKDGVVVTRDSVFVAVYDIPLDAQFIVAKKKRTAE